MGAMATILVILKIVSSSGCKHLLLPPVLLRRQSYLRTGKTLGLKKGPLEIQISLVPCGHHTSEYSALWRRKEGGERQRGREKENSLLERLNIYLKSLLLLPREKLVVSFLLFTADVEILDENQAQYSSLSYIVNFGSIRFS